MLHQPRTLPIRAAIACAIGLAVAVWFEDPLLFAICSFALAFVVHELRQTILFNRDLEKLAGRVED